MSTNSSSTHLMTEGNILKEILLFSVPLILGNLLQQFYNTFDSIIVGKFVGANALAAVGSSGSMIFLIISFAQGAAVGAGVIVSQYLGGQNRNGVQKTVHTSIAIALFLGVVMSILGVLVSRPLLLWMDTPKEVLPESIVYLKIYFAGTIFTVLYNMVSGILNAVGNSKRSLIYLAIASITNIVLDIVLVALLRMGIAGAAFATVFSQFISCVFSMRFLLKTNESYQVSLKKIRFHKMVCIRIIKVGLPAGIQNTVIAISNVLVQASVNGFGATSMAGFGAYLKVDGFNILPVMSISMAVTTFTGQNFGAGKLDRVKKGMNKTLWIGIVYTVVTGALILLFADPIMRLFTDDPGVVAYGKQAMRYFCPFYWLLGFLHVMAGTVRGTGKTFQTMVVFLVSLCVCRVIWIWAVLRIDHKLSYVMTAYPVTWLIGAVLIALYVWKGKWMPEAYYRMKKEV